MFYIIGFATHQYYVLKRKDSELRASNAWNDYDTQHPMVCLWVLSVMWNSGTKLRHARSILANILTEKTSSRRTLLCTSTWVCTMSLILEICPMLVYHSHFYLHSNRDTHFHTDCIFDRPERYDDPPSQLPSLRPLPPGYPADSYRL